MTNLVLFIFNLPKCYYFFVTSFKMKSIAFLAIFCGGTLLQLLYLQEFKLLINLKPIIDIPFFFFFLIRQTNRISYSRQLLIYSMEYINSNKLSPDGLAAQF